MVNLDLDDISQPDNGAHSAGDGEITESDSECSVKEDYVDEEPNETKYIPIVEEEFGDVSWFGIVISNYLLDCFSGWSTGRGIGWWTQIAYLVLG